MPDVGYGGLGPVGKGVAPLENGGRPVPEIAVLGLESELAVEGAPTPVDNTILGADGWFTPVESGGKIPVDKGGKTPVPRGGRTPVARGGKGMVMPELTEIGGIRRGTLIPVAIPLPTGGLTLMVTGMPACNVLLDTLAYTRPARRSRGRGTGSCRGCALTANNDGSASAST